jgi:hypothetical protein
MYSVSPGRILFSYFWLGFGMGYRPLYLVQPAGVVDPKVPAEDLLMVAFGQRPPIDTLPKQENIGLPLCYRSPGDSFDLDFDERSEAWALTLHSG